MSEYQVIARKFRPQTFKDVVAQEAIIRTLKNAIQYKRLAQAYLFCGSRGTGKTTLARILAKALNCHQLSTDGEPCNTCSSCREISLGSSLDVLEIDGASNRGIEDIRQINENVGYAPASGRYKIYLIDEVHMLTKDAFNALLKTLEEPPAMVKFFFATTEPHKIPATILSRCQRFNLERIPPEKIVEKLRTIADTLNTHIDDEALQLIAQRAEGGLRDAESLLDQIMAFQEGAISGSAVRDILGLMPRETYFILDTAGKAGDFGKAFELAQQVFSQGKNLVYFVEELTEHIRTLLLIKCGGERINLIALSDEIKKQYQSSASLYTQEQCLNLLEYLIEAQQSIRFAPSGRIALESILLHVMRSHFRLPVEVLVQRLSQLEKGLATAKPEQASQQNQQKPPPVEQKSANPVPMSVDPTPSATDLGVKPKASPPSKTKSAEPPKIESIPTPIPASPSTPPQSPSSTLSLSKEKQSHYDTLVQFAAVEWEARIQKQ